MSLLTPVSPRLHGLTPSAFSKTLLGVTRGMMTPDLWAYFVLSLITLYCVSVFLSALAHSVLVDADSLDFRSTKHQGMSL